MLKQKAHVQLDRHASKLTADEFCARLTALRARLRT
jgi:hypothetical protein